jgi:t-SNARE complex subunit (syntaxin)
VPNYLVQAILTTVFCCLPLGIVSIVYAAQVNGKVAAGDRAGALESSRNARLWAWISFGVGLLGIVGWVIFVVLSVIAQS